MRAFAFSVTLLAIVAGGALISQTLSAAPAWVQSSSAVPQTPQTSVSVPYTAAQTAGHLNVVIVGWNDTTHVVSSVTDSHGQVWEADDYYAGGQPSNHWKSVAGTFKGFSAVCTHQGCIVATIANGTIDCPCHGSKFSIKDGSVVNGPAPSPLPPVAITVQGTSILKG